MLPAKESYKIQLGISTEQYRYWNNWQINHLCPINIQGAIIKWKPNQIKKPKYIQFNVLSP